ncbi:Fructose-bisphosphate aldolase B [mine drainage metagenome]|uniref:fructose-bisphosphate aldolase n=3 Tax=mine drainage metagenome TaxID=410659 RepID=T1CPU3_9ZZZZ
MQIEETARRLVAPERGILAADESSATIGKRFEALGIPCTAETRRAYRGLLFSSPGIERHLSGVILYDETLKQSAQNGERFVDLLASRGILPGIKVDGGAKPFAGHPGEFVTEGLDGLRERLGSYRDLGARFTKWRAVIAIDALHPSRIAVRSNAEALARYVMLAQEQGLVPIVEPEVLMEGDHDQARCEAVTGEVLQQVFDALHAHGACLEGLVLKPNMVVAGKKCPNQSTVEAVAEATLRTLTRFVPAAVPGIAFLSGGQTPERATAHLNAMNQSQRPLPWQVTFSFSRALQEPPLGAWAGQAERVVPAQKLFAHRVRLNSLARMGRYSHELEEAV